MPSRVGVWTRSAKRPKVEETEKASIVAACDAFVRDVLKPRFLAEIRPTPWNYPVDIRGEWRGGRYRFIQRYRSGFSENLGEEFDAPFARIDRIGRGQFDVYWMRHNDTWWLLHRNVTLREALALIETDEILHPC